MATKDHFVIPKRYNSISLVLMAVGILSVIILLFTHGLSDDPKVVARFWASLLQNSVYFLLVVNSAMFFVAATTLAWGSWHVTFKKVPEAIAACVPVIGIITGIILLALVFGGNHEIYHWTDYEHVKHDDTLLHKSGFLSKTFFTIWTLLTLVGWWFLGKKMRDISIEADDKPMTLAEGKKYIWKNTVWSASFLAFFGLTVMSTTPWLWLMSIDAHWYSTMYSWYTFSSSFVAAIALITLYVVFLKNNGYLEYTTDEHLHDLGKFMFAFSIFWAYLWYSQFMLIWYANIPEETTYFEPRMQGVYRGVFLLNLVINFLAPLLILMTRRSKRNYGTITMMSVLIIFGHWLDFFQMVHPGPSRYHVPFMLVDFGIALGFVGIIMFVTSRALSRSALVSKNHPFLKESIIHHT